MSKKLPDGIVDIRGKSYQTVAYRVSAFRQAHPEHSLTTEVIVRDTECVVVCATIADPTGRVIANGHSEEYRKSSQINRTSALENAETSAIGRALAAFGMGGTEFASANEVQNAIQQQADGRREGQSQEDAVAPPADPTKGWREPDSVFSTPSKLHKIMMSLDHDLNGCGDSSMVYAITATAEWKEFVRVSEIHCPHYLRGGEPAPDDFEGLIAKAENLVKKFDSDEAQQMAGFATA